MRKLVLIISSTIPLAAVYAQNALDSESDEVLMPNTGHFFLSLLAGLILTVAFHLIMTNLSIAAGLNVLDSATSNTNKRNNVNIHGGKSESDTSI